MLGQEHMSSLFENATEGIILTDEKGVVVLVNPAAQQIFGYQAEEIVGKSIELLIPDRHRSQHRQYRQGFYQHPSNRVMGQGRDLYGKKKDGSNISVEVSLSHYRKDDQLYVIAFIVDITRRKEIERSMLEQQQKLEGVTTEIRKLNAELEAKVEERTMILKEALHRLERSQEELSAALDKERQLNEIKGRFVAMASHEFRTPLSAILSSATLLSRYKTTEDEEKRARHISRIKNSVWHLNDILEDFLSMGKLDEKKVSVDVSAFSLQELIAETVEEMSRQTKKDQQIFLSCEAGEPVSSDRKLLKNIIINLVNNAIKFSEGGSRIDVAAIQQPGKIVVTVTDRGIGISEEDQTHLFSSFFRGSNASNIAGTGLGLHIVKRYVNLLKGDIHLQSELGKGTTVNVTIPLKQDHT